MAVNIDGDTGIDKVQTGAVEIQDIAATGTASSSTFLRGDGAWESAGQAPEVQVFTAPGTWTKPATVKQIKVTVVGGGGGRPGPGTNVGGGGGGAAIRWISAPSIPGPVSVTRGAGSTGGTGGTSSFGAFASATGGGTSTGGTGSSGDLNIGGQSGMANGGGSSILGGGGGGGNEAGKLYGGGGGSGPSPTVGTSTGADGVIIVEEFY
jgi:hypothetical protein